MPVGGRLTGKTGYTEYGYSGQGLLIYCIFNCTHNNNLKINKFVCLY